MVSIHPIFPTLIGIGKIENHADYLPLFLRLLGDKTNDNKSCPDLKHTPDIRSNIPEFLDILTREVTQYANHHFGLKDDRCKWICNNAWLNESGHQAFQTSHNHANTFLSVVYYVDFPDGASQTRLLRPEVHMHPFMKFDPDFYHEGNYEYVSPGVKTGDFLIFPSYLRHEVPPNINPIRPRITLACNYMPSKIDYNSYVMEIK